jgi:hypothetical protein
VQLISEPIGASCIEIRLGAWLLRVPTTIEEQPLRQAIRVVREEAAGNPKQDTDLPQAICEVSADLVRSAAPGQLLFFRRQSGRDRKKMSDLPAKNAPFLQFNQA